MKRYQEGMGSLIRFMFIFALSANLLDTARALSDKRLCADENCKEIISMGIGMVNYPAGAEGMVSFKANSNIRIKSKSAGKDRTLWGVEVNGREGYAPKNLIRETKVLKKETDLKYEVDVEPLKKVPDLATSEKMLQEKTAAETTITTPLNVEPKKSTESPNEKFNVASPPLTPPVPSNVMDSTEMPVNANDGNGNAKNENVDPINNIGTQPATSNENEDRGHQNDAKDEEKVEHVQEQSKAVDVNIANTTKDTVEEVSSKTAEENREDVSINVAEIDEVNESVRQMENNTDSSETLTQEHINPKEFNIAQKIKEESTNIEESPAKESQDSLITNDQNNSTSAEQMQNHNDNIEMVPENSQQKSHANVRNTTTESSNSSNDTSYDMEHNSNITDSEESSKEYTTHQNQKTAAVRENSKEEETKQTGLNEDPEYSVENQNYDGETGITHENSQQNPLENDKNETTKTSAYDSTKEKTEVKDEKHSSNSANLDKTDPETKGNINLNNKEISSASNSTYQEQVTQTVNNEDSLNESLPKVGEESMVEQPATGSNVDDKYETSSENLPQTEYTFKTLSKVHENDVTENKVSELKSANYEVVDTDKTKNITNITKHADESINSTSNDNINSKNFDNNLDVQHQQPYEDITLKQSELDTTTAGSPEVSDETQQSPKDNTKEVIPNTTPQIPPSQKEVSDETQQSPKDNTKEVIPNTTPQIPPSQKEVSDETQQSPTDNTKEVIPNTTPQIPPSQKEIVLENINPTTYKPSDDIPFTTPLSTKVDYSYEEQAINILPNKQQTDNNQNKLDSSEKPTTETYNSVPTIISTASVSQSMETKNDPKALPSATPTDAFEVKENKGLFATIMGTVNNVLSTHNKNKQNAFDGDNELNSILYSKKSNNAEKLEKINEANSLLYCKNIESGGDCPQTEQNHDSSEPDYHHAFPNSILDSDLFWDAFLKSMGAKILEMSELLAFLAVVAATVLLFLFGYYCFCNSSREGALLSKLNQLESCLLATHKENAILKHNLMATRQKLASIEDNSFGSNDMVVSLKKELEEELMEKARLQEQITVLQKELENAADAGIELNKIVSELLSNQTGDESIISSVEELQKQLNEQQNTIFEINASLAEKSRENSELQLLIAEQNARFETELATVQRDNDELEHEKGNLLTKLDEMKNDFDKDITAALEGKNMEIKRLQNDIVDLTNKLENEHTKWQTSLAKIEALEECLKNIRKDPNVNITEVINVAYVKAQLIEIQQKYNSLREKHETELDSRKLAESQLEMVCMEVEKLKQDFNQSEKDKLEAQTRLEVLSNYFKDKENQLQKELNLKEAMWLKQQGETTTTVDRLTAMQEEIQSLKSQNDSLRAEIEAQVAAYKAKTGTLENRAHETWLAARQSDRRYEEARAEATALRRKLTALAGGNASEVNKPSAAAATLGDELAQAPSPIHMESPGSPMLGRMPPPPFLPPPFMGHPPPFMGMPPPPPFVPPGEMRPAPLGRIMSPPPQRSGRFSPQHLDYDDYLDYDANNTWHRHTYSPPPRTYRSLSPTDSRYNYGTERDLMSTYDTETDFSPPPSPRESRRRVGTSSEKIDTKISYGNTKKFNSSNKDPLSSGSEISLTPLHNETKTKKGYFTGGGKSLV